MPENPTFTADIKPLFREMDRSNMTFKFDLWDYEDVKANADAILESVAEGDMPCDAPWEPEQVDLFRAWIAAGHQN